MLGWEIFAHSVRMVFGNFRQVLQIALGPAVIATAVIVGLFLLLGIPLESFDDTANASPENLGSITVFTFLVVVVVFIVMFWIAVSWHRFILLEEYPSGLLPTFRFDRILAYLGRFVLLGLLMAIGLIPVGLILSVLGESAGLIAVVISFGAALVLVVCFYRLSIILPAAAIGNPITLGDAWNRTSGVAGAIVVLLVVSFVFQILVQFALAALAIIPVLGVLLTVFFGSLILPMINVSILTTMYGIFVEKCELT